ncbi:MAG: aspartate aminotransferase family protein [Candidatus Omnitrophota bacterium]
MTKEEIFKTYSECIMPTYRRQNVIFVKGKGTKLWDIDGKEYLDFFPGWGVNNLGHCHSKVMCAIRDQVSKLIFVPNNYLTVQQAKLAKEINFWAYDSKVFFCNSGAEAIESAIKFSRAYGKGERYEIITFLNSFHGRTCGALSATGQEKHKKPFEPLVPGFKTVTFNDIEQLKQTITAKTVAILLELVQGEGGVNIADKNFVLELRKICDEKNILLIFDEIQTGMGRTAKLFCYEHYGVIPDLMVLAKAIAGGLPLGVLVAKREIADSLQPGMHGSTFGGGPVVCKAALAVFRAIQKEKLITNAQKMGDYLKEKLINLKEKYSCIIDVRGLGLMYGVELNIDGKILVEKALSLGLLINCTQDKVIRLMPPLNVTKKQIDKAAYILEKVFKELECKKI